MAAFSGWKIGNNRRKCSVRAVNRNEYYFCISKEVEIGTRKYVTSITCALCGIH